MSDNKHKEHKSGFVAVMGRPNVGKSTLLNALLGQKIAAVSPKPQTTRMQQLGILSLDMAQIIFIDTPGVHQPHHKLGEYMNSEAQKAVEDADLGLLIVDGSVLPPHKDDYLLVELINKLSFQPNIVLALNKIDRIEKKKLDKHIEAYQQILPQAKLVPISAVRGDNLPQLIKTLINYLPEFPPFFPKEQITNLYERDIAADLIRAAAMVNLKHELPHVIAVRIDTYKEKGEKGGYIEATIFVERESQKGIVIGRNGRMIKRIGSMARKEIESMSGRKVYLKLRVKVRKNWRNNENILKLFGFKKS